MTDIQTRPYHQCKRCILDNVDDPDITFNAEGVCSYCTGYDAHKSDHIKANDSQALEHWVNQIKKAGAGKPFDCVLGLSGGVDSTYLAIKAKELGLRPLAFHFDNGWNSELAVSNIENIVVKLGLELKTFVIDWEEFRELQKAFIRASVIDIELVTDHAILASMYKMAVEYKIKYILSGVNYATESILPLSWIHAKRDYQHIRAINKLFGTLPLRKFPLLNSLLNFQIAWRGITSVPLLNYFPYVKSDVKKIISEKVGWRDYGGKHYESVFTRFYQGYILPQKFHVDKRKAHLSNLICSGQITREEALVEINTTGYPEDIRRSDFEFVLKKLELSEDEFNAIMKQPVKKHTDFPVETELYSRFPFLRLFRPFWHTLKKVKHG